MYGMVCEVLVVLSLLYSYMYFILGALISFKNRNLLSPNMQIFRKWLTTF